MRCLVFCQERIGASDAVFFVPHRSAKSGCFGEYLNVFAGFLCCFVLFYEVFWNLSRIEF